MSIKILTANATDNTNIDGARENHFAASMKSGIVKGAFNEGNFFASASNIIALDTCELLISGHRIVIDSVQYITLSNRPSVTTRYSMIAEVSINDASQPTFRLFIQPSSNELIQQNLYKTANGTGTYQIKIGNFTLDTNGEIRDVNRLVDLISGGGDGASADIEFNATAETIASGSQPEVNVDYNEETKKYDMQFKLPASEGTNVLVGGVVQKEFNADTKADKKDLQELQNNAVTINDNQNIPGIKRFNSIQGYLNGLESYQQPNAYRPLLNEDSSILNTYGDNRYKTKLFGSAERPTYTDANGKETDIALKDDIKSGLPIGTIISSAVVLNDAGLHLLDGSSLATSGVYAEFCTWLTQKYNADNSSVPTCTEDEFNNEVNTFGQCGKFVITNEYVRLPLITKFIEGIEKIGDIGKSLQAGIPNIEGSIEGRPHQSGSSGFGGALVASNGAFEYVRHGGSSTDSGVSESSTQSKRDIVRLDASRSSPIYGNSDTVQPQATKYPYYIVVATMTKTDIEVNLDNVASDLNLKANSDLSNVDDNIFKPKLGYEQVETIYDMASSDSSKNWGYTSGIGSGVSVSGKNFSKYKKLKLFCSPNNGIGVYQVIFEIDLTRNLTGEYGSSIVGWDNTSYQAFVNSEKTILRMGTSYSSGCIFRIEGEY